MSYEKHLLRPLSPDTIKPTPPPRSREEERRLYIEPGPWKDFEFQVQDMKASLAREAKTAGISLGIDQDVVVEIDVDWDCAWVAFRFVVVNSDYDAELATYVTELAAYEEERRAYLQALREWDGRK